MMALRETHPETIAAIATAPGRAGIGIVRSSGPAAPAIAERVCGPLPAPRTATLACARDARGEIIDRGILLFFEAPRSYTGEHVVEFQGHGGAVVQHLVLQRFLECGARRARAGEFTQRAFLNGRMDLTQAEAVADLIDASSVQAARAAQRSLAGELSRRVDRLARELGSLRVQVEAALDFPDEEIDLLDDAGIEARFDALRRAVGETIDAARAGRRLRDSVSVVIAGAPNVGKSSLLNRLSGVDRAIVNETPGTTRDTVLEQVVIAGLSMQLCDTAGLRESADAIEIEGIRRAREQVARADVVLLVSDASAGPPAAVQLDPAPHARVIEVRNKIDLCAEPAASDAGAIAVSARTGAGMERLEQALAQAASQGHGEGEFTARQRHLDALEHAAGAIERALESFRRRVGTELVAEDLADAERGLEELIGRVTSDDLLGRIFATFCIGK